MATLEQIAAALRAADAAGNAEDARALAAAYREMQAQPQMQDHAEANSAASQASQRLQGKVADLPSQRPSFADEAMSFGRGVIDGIPVIGPTLSDWRRGLDSNISALLHGGNADEIKEGYKAADDELASKTGGARFAGSLTGSVASLAPLGATSIGGRLLGMTGGFGTRLGMGATSGGILAGADTLARGGSLEDAYANVAIGFGLGGAIPVAGAGLRMAGNALTPLVGSVASPVKEAFRRTGTAFGRDMQANAAGVMNQADEAIAAASGVPLINADRGGETVRALARSVANQSPEARGVIEKVASDRFSGQADRAVNFIRRIAGGNVDDLAYQQSLKSAASLTNKPRYDAAMNSPKAGFVWSQPIADLMQSPTFRSAVQSADVRGADKAAIAGVKAVRNPFQFGADGSIKIRSNPDGTRALPSLAFWDQVKRNLDGMIGTAQRSGDNALTTDLTQMKQKLVAALDDAVHEYKAARAGAAAYFGAEDAVEAGKMFANKTRELPEAHKAFQDMTESERKAFRVGFASEIIDKIKDARFRANVIDQAFGSPAKREMIELAFGKAKARELEAYVRVEELADKLRGAMGNSTTARQLMELGIGAGSGALLTGGDWKGALSGAALVKGGRFLAQRADNKVMQEVAKLLTSDNPADIQKAIANASVSPNWMNALESLEKVFAPAVPAVEASKAPRSD